MEQPDSFVHESLKDRDGLPCLSETRSLAPSDHSMDNRRDFSHDHPETDYFPRPKPGLSETRSLALSDHSMDNRRDFRSDHPETDYCPRPQSGLREDPNTLGCEKSLTELDKVFMRLEEKIMLFVKEQLRGFHKLLASEHCDGSSGRQEQSTENPQRTSEHEEERGNMEAVLNLALNFLRRMDKKEMAQDLKNNTEVRVCNSKMKNHLEQRYNKVFEGVAKAGTPTSLNQIYTELYVTKGGASEVNQEHEVRHIETASRKKADTPIACDDIFKPQPDTEEPIRAVLTTGVAGVGKTVLTQKFSLDWAEGKANQDIQLLFPITFRELNVLRDSEFSLVGLLHHFFSEARELCSFKDLQVLFILDGLDECRLPLDFSQTRVLTKDTERASLEELLVNLIRGSLLPSARLWITTRPAAANQIPAECISMVTEVRGFTDPQKKQYFKKRFKDDHQATTVISHIRTIRSLYIMSHIPIFCWILSTVLQHLMETRKTGHLPQTLTQMYIHFLVVQAKVKNIKYHEGSGTDHHWTPGTREMVRALAKLAFEQLQKGNLIFYESDLNECGLDAAAASVYSGMFTQVFKEELGLYQDKVYCFIHLTVQEFLAALHVHQTFTESGVNLLEEQKKGSPLGRPFKRKCSLSRFHRFAVDKALQSPNGHLDLFLRFLLGLSLPTNQRLLPGLLTPSKCDLTYKTEWYIKKKLNEGLSAERSLNLLHCLNEVNSSSLVEHIRSIVREGGLNLLKTPAQWSALSFLLLSSDLVEFDLRRYHSSEKALLKLLPVVKASTKAILSGCGLSPRSCASLASVFSSSSLTHLDLSNNDLQDSGVELLCDGLKSAAWRLHTLSLSGCGLSPLSCGPLGSVLSSSSLTHLDLSYNDIQDSGVELLCDGLKSTLCRLHTLRLSGCMVSEKGGASLTSALSLGSSRLRELDLRYNNPGPSAKLLTALRDDPHCPLDSLRLDPGGERFMVPGLRKYSCEFSLDENTAHSNLVLSKDKQTATHVERDQKYPSHQKRFADFSQVLASTGLSGRCYWEVSWIKRSSEWSATFSERVHIAVSYRGISRSGDGWESFFGENSQSWSLRYMNGQYSIWHNGRETSLSKHSSRRVGVFLDSEAGVLSFYLVLPDGKLSHLHTTITSFTEPVFPGFGVGPDAIVSLVKHFRP